MDAWLGCDPGRTGAVGLLTDTDVIEVLDWDDVIINTVAVLRAWKRVYNIRGAALEKVSSHPKQGVVSVFSFGQNYGTWHGILITLGVPYVTVTPQEWQKGLVDRKGAGDPKQASVVTIKRMFPDAPVTLKKHHGRADALCMAYWLRNKQIQGK